MTTRESIDIIAILKRKLTENIFRRNKEPTNEEKGEEEMKKRIVALVMAGVMAASLTACGGSDTGATTAATTEAEKTEAAGAEESKAADAQPAGSVTADAFRPSKDFNIRVPFAAGGSADTTPELLPRDFSRPTETLLLSTT